MNKTDTLSQHTQSDLSYNDNKDLISVLESHWITDEVIQLYYGILSLTIVSDNDNIFPAQSYHCTHFKKCRLSTSRGYYAAFEFTG